MKSERASGVRHAGEPWPLRPAPPSRGDTVASYSQKIRARSGRHLRSPTFPVVGPTPSAPAAAGTSSSSNSSCQRARVDVDELTGEEALRALQLERGYARVVARVGVQLLLAGGEGIKQRQARLARHQLIVPLQQELDRDRDPGRRLGQGVVAHEAEDGGGNPRVGRHQRHADRAAQRHAPEPHRPAGADAVKFLEGVQGGLPLGNGPRRASSVVAGDLRADGLACSQPLPHACCEPLVLLGSWPVAVPGRVDGRHREAAGRHVAVGAGHQARNLLVLPAAMAQQHQGAAAGGIGR
jgi:hypothetical protein